MAGTELRLDGLDEAEKRLASVISSEYPKEFERIVTDLAFELQGRVKKRTPVKTSYLRNNWRVGDIVRRGDEYYIEVYNNTEYAEPVEYGHIQKAGRYVPALGKRLKASFVPGKHMMEISLAELNAVLPGYLQEWLNNFLNTHEII